MINNQNKSLNIIFAGTPDFAAQHLNELIKTKHKIVAVFTQPDKPAGRGKQLTESPVKILAKENQIPVFQPENFKSKENQDLIKNLQADIMIVVAYGIILPQAILDIPALGCLNVHGSLLPKWRGAAPIQRACLAGDSETGITIMQMDAGLDTGDMIYKLKCDINANDTSASLYEKLAQLGPKALINTLELIINKAHNTEKQNNDEATYAQKLSKQEAKLNWQLTANELERCVRAFNPWPVSYFEIDNILIKVWQANVIEKPCLKEPGTIIEANKNGIQVATKQGALNLTSLQVAGKKRVSAEELLNSRKSWFEVGTKLN